MAKDNPSDLIRAKDVSLFDRWSLPSFDPQGEKDFFEECRELLEKRTVILITHRPASLALADKVLKMDLSHEPAYCTKADDNMPNHEQF